MTDKMSKSFEKKNNSYSHCPLKKRPVNVEIDDDGPESSVEDEKFDSSTDTASEPENLSTKPEDLSKTSRKRSASPSLSINKILSPSPPASPEANNNNNNNNKSAATAIEQQHQPSPAKMAKIAESPKSSFLSPPPSPETSLPQYPHYASPMFHPAPLSPPQHMYSAKSRVASSVAAAIQPIAKKGRVEVIQHASPPPMHFMAPRSPLDVDQLTTPHYSQWRHPHPHPFYGNFPSYYSAAAAAAAVAQDGGFHPASLPRYPYSYFSPASSGDYHASFSPPLPVSALGSSPHHHTSGAASPASSTVSTQSIQKPVARIFHTQWPSAPVDAMSMSPTSSTTTMSMCSPPPISPEDLSSPGSDSGCSSNGSVSSERVNNVSERSPRSAGDRPQGAKYTCDACQKTYSTHSGLTKHQQFHCAAADGMPKKVFSCKYCTKTYMTLGALKMHIRTHTLPCKCETCGKAFSRPWLLQGHIRTHTGEKPFSCQHCHRAFADRSNLRAHLQTHSDVKKYCCESCKKTFSRMSLLTKHQEGGCPGVVSSVNSAIYGC
ncbi:protein escargot-like [Trichogramma pretiosum]|uniref:protein escargot-like n=1 Tax=Trichogramma pretiosum TaxID=7493 RepID=UPI0006C9950F|nr:protein escargot-like [Trichogramma pretiosum]